MTLDSLIDNYGGDFKLKKGIDIRKLEQYKFQPLFTSEGKLIAEVLWIIDNKYGRIPILCMTTETIYRNDFYRKFSDYNLALYNWALVFDRTCMHNPLREKELTFFNYQKEAETGRKHNGIFSHLIDRTYNILKLKYGPNSYKYRNSRWMGLAARKLEGIMFNVILTLMENGIIERTRGNSKAELNFGRQKPKRGRKKKVRD